MGTSGLEPPTSRLSGVRSNHLSYAPKQMLGYNIQIKRVTRIELATTAWKAVVLPLNYTRLLLKEMARDGIEPPTHGASIHCSTNWATEPNCGSRIWTYDLRVMSPTSYRAAPSRVNYKEDGGFEPTHAFTRLTVFKTVPFSRTWVILQIL